MERIEKYKRLNEGKGLTLEPDEYFVFDVKRWFQKTYGNTYHSAKVYKVDGKGKQTLIAEEPFNYGYGDQYIETIAILLGVESRALRDDMRKYKTDKYVVNVKDVKNKKDM